eukprot:885395-Pleurochrysis_carterae.AAC.1
MIHGKALDGAQGLEAAFPNHALCDFARLLRSRSRRARTSITNGMFVLECRWVCLQVQTKYGSKIAACRTLNIIAALAGCLSPSEAVRQVRSTTPYMHAHAPAPHAYT